MKNLILSLSLIFSVVFMNAQNSDKLGIALSSEENKKVVSGISYKNTGINKLEINLSGTDNLVLEAEGNPSTGYSWIVTEIDESVLKLIDKRYVPTKAIGVDMIDRLVLQGLKQGTTELILTYKRTWEDTEISKYIIKINVEGKYTGDFSYVPAPVKMVDPKSYPRTKSGLPSYFDWRDQGVVTSVKNQGPANSCWAFGTTAAFEAAIKKEVGKTVDLSEQWLGDCNGTGSNFEGGGWFTFFMYTDYGAVYEEEKPYLAKIDDCFPPYDYQEKASAWGYTDGKSNSLSPSNHHATDEQIKQAIYEHGPVAASLFTGSWSSDNSYNSDGVFVADDGDGGGHIILITGWDDNLGCWFIKNSWGEGFNSKRYSDPRDWGYIRIAYGLTSCEVGWVSAWIDYENTTNQDCFGVVNGHAYLDTCNNCVGGTTGQIACEIDLSGNKDCNGEVDGSAYFDNCNNCVEGNTGKTACVQDCNNDWGGEAYLDNCSSCVGGYTGETDCSQDCNGDWGGKAYLDNCNQCVGGLTDKDACKIDCNGVNGGTAYLDNCGTCVGGNTGEIACSLDCNGDADGSAIIDECGNCVSGNTGSSPCNASGYCSAEGSTETVSEYIRNVTYGTINNNTSQNYLYADYTNMSSNFSPEEKFTVSIKIDFALNGCDVFAWVDWNNDKTFSDSERYDFSEISLSVRTATTEITVPTDADGAYIMRIRSIVQENVAVQDPCGTYKGEVEDYTVNVISPILDCNGDEDGLAYYDGCGNCVGGQSGNNPCVVSILENNSINDYISIEPNPNNGLFKVSLDVEDDLQLIIVDMNGKTVYDKEIVNVEGINNQIIDIRNQPAGIYYVKIISEKVNLVEKIVLID